MAQTGQRTHSIDRITPHCVVGQCTAEGLGDWFAKSSTKASSNYGIDKDGRVGLYVEEKNRSWCSSSNANDQRAITIECASDTSEPYAFRHLAKTTNPFCQRPIDISDKYPWKENINTEQRDQNRNIFLRIKQKILISPKDTHLQFLSIKLKTVRIICFRYTVRRFERL